MRCTTCNIEVMAKQNFVKFRCPDCGDTEIIRCYNCKALSSKYSCTCGFVGP